MNDQARLQAAGWVPIEIVNGAPWDPRRTIMPGRSYWKRLYWQHPRLPGRRYTTLQALAVPREELTPARRRAAP